MAEPETGLSVELPLWTIVIRADHASRGLPWSIYLPSYFPFTGQVFPLFTDNDLALRHIEDSGRADLDAHTIESKELLYTLLDDMKKVSLYEAGIDCPTRDNPRMESGWIIGVNRIKEIVEGQ